LFAAALGLASTGFAAASDPEPASAAVLNTPAVLDGQTNPLHFSERMEDYQAAIARLETEFGAWGNGLSEQLSGLGQSYQRRGLHRQAIEIFDRAVHISRVNNGLYDLSQVPIIESMLESLKARGRWEEVHERHQYLFWLHERNFGANDPRMLPIIDRLGKWYINDYALNPQRRIMDQLVDAHNLFQQAINIISGSFGESDLRLIEPLRGLVMSNWYFANYQGEGLASPLERERLTRELGVDQVAFLQEPASNQLSQYLRNNYGGGKQAIEKMVAIYSESPDAPPGAAARAKVELADWEQLFKRRNTAAALYREAWMELAANQSTSSQVDKLFARPVALPDLGFVEAEVSSTPVADSGAAEPMNYVLVSFDVNRFGDVQNIEILEAVPENSADQQARIRETLQSTRFRPRLVN